MNWDEIATVAAAITGCAGLALTILDLGVRHGKDAVRREAIKAGVAEWKTDPETLRPMFTWKKRP